MKQPVAAAAADMTRVSRVRVQIRADGFIYEGYVFLLAETRRIQEVLNDPKPFLNLTDVVIHDGTNATTHHAPYVALNKGAITHVVVIAGDSTGDSADSEGDVGGARSAPRVVAAQPTVPPVGPRTMPVPPPRGSKNDPPTQPFPRQTIQSSAVEDDDVSDLILDDDGDDVDPDDLERDVGALIAGSEK